MLKATHKGRAATLSKALLTAGLLGGAALSTLGAGSAKADWEAFDNGYKCGFGGTGVAQCERGVRTPTTVPNPPGDGVFPSDKFLTLLNWGSIPGSDSPGTSNPEQPSTLSFNYVISDVHPWHVDLDLAGGQKDFDGGFLEYTMEIVDPKYDFALANLQYAAPSGSVTKQVFSDSTFATQICSLTADNSTCAISGKQIWVRDTWAASPGVGTDNLANDFSQTVPGPLPLLGAGAAFGFSRRIRSRIKGARLV